jgi:hypothetical protein
MLASESKAYHETGTSEAIGRNADLERYVKKQ